MRATTQSHAVVLLIPMEPIMCHMLPRVPLAALQVIARKHVAISAAFAEVQAAQAAADGRLAQLSKQLSAVRASRAGGSRTSSRAGSRAFSSSDAQFAVS